MPPEKQNGPGGHPAHSTQSDRRAAKHIGLQVIAPPPVLTSSNAPHPPQAAGQGPPQP